MYRGTTPKLIFTVSKNLDLTLVDKIWITFDLKPGLLTFEKDDVTIDATNHKITLQLSQEDTLKFNHNQIDLQIRFKLTDGRASSTPIRHITVNKIIKDGEI